jgi:HD-GYP domain-containing protein (c-di-GMP phosphodiesterase class II)
MIKRILVTQLQVGMFVQELDGAWLEHPFWRSSFMVDSAAMLRRVVGSGIREVWIDTSRGLDVAGGESREEVEAEVERQLATDDATVQGEPADREHVPSEAELEVAAKICRRARHAVAELFRQARMGRALDAAVVIPVVDEIAGSVARNPSVLTSLSRFRHRDEYTFMHSVAVGALMISLGRRLNLDESALRALGLAGLFHDIGKVSVPLAILNKRGALVEAEFSIVRRHAEAGHRLLARGKHVDEVVLDVCLHHHEKMNGEGYPHRLAGDAISEPARMAAICDIYDATTSDRPYKAAWSAAKSLRRMAEWTPAYLDNRLFHALVRAVGIYPVGTLVRLKSARLAIVVDQNEQSLLAPRVKVFHSVKSGGPLPHQIIDLSGDTEDSIVSHEDPATFGFGDLRALWAGDVAIQ